MHEQLLKTIKLQVASLIFRVSLTSSPKQGPGRMEERKPVATTYNPRSVAHNGSENPDSRQVASGESSVAGRNKVGRNDPCPCGSGKKWKRCHGV